MGFLTNANFESTPGGLPFDWQIGTGLNAIAEIVPLAGPGTRHALRISLGNGRVKLPEVSQVILLGPRRYRLKGEVRGQLSGKRGLRWQIRCASGARRVLGETEMLLGQSEQWRILTLVAGIPPLENCRGQELRLFHDARSASEELLYGTSGLAISISSEIPARILDSRLYRPPRLITDIRDKQTRYPKVCERLKL